MEEIILLSYGNGGEETKKLIEEVIKRINNDLLGELLDSAILQAQGHLAFTTDSFVVSPIFFKGGDIGVLSIYGTANDLAVVGAKPQYISLSFIIEEGLKMEEFEKILDSIESAAEECDVMVVTGDTKVVEKGKGDKIFINTSGIGFVERRRIWKGREIKGGDVVIISGTIGDHGMCIMLERLGIKTGEEVKSDLAPIQKIVLPLLEEFDTIKFMRDPTRGGVATILNEIAQKYEVEIEIFEENLPIKNWVRSGSNILGIDPLYLANEGKCLMVVDGRDAEKVLSFLREHPLGKDSAIIGEVKGKGNRVYLRTQLGTRRIVDTLKKEILPRIC